MSPSTRPVNRTWADPSSTASRALLEERGDVEVVVAAPEVELVVGAAKDVVLGRLEPEGAAPLAATALALVPPIEAGSDDRDPHLVAHRVGDGGAEAAVGGGVGDAATDLRRLGDLERAPGASD